MQVAIIGGSGFIGSSLVDEALSQGHFVHAVFRRPIDFEHANYQQHNIDIFDEKALVKVIKQVDVVISAYNPGNFHYEQAKRFVDAYDVIFKVTKKLKKRIIIMIGATTLITEDGTLVKEGFYSGQWIKALLGTDLVYEKYRDDETLNATFVSPAAEVFDGYLTGNYAYSENYLIYDQNRISRISIQDLSQAVIKELSEEKYVNKRFTVAYQKS